MFQVVRGERPPRKETHWLQNDTWKMIVACWDQQPDERQKISTLQNQLLAASDQVIKGNGQDAIARQGTSYVKDAISSSDVQEILDSHPQPLAASNSQENAIVAHGLGSGNGPRVVSPPAIVQKKRFLSKQQFAFTNILKKISNHSLRDDRGSTS